MTETSLYYLAYACLVSAAITYTALLRHQNANLERAAPLLSTSALALLLVGTVIRGVRAAHLPFATSYEFALLFLAAIVAIYLLLEQVARRRRMSPPLAGGAFVLPLACLIGLYPLFGVDSAARAVSYLPPALQSIWFPLHVGAALGAYGAFAVAAGGGALYLLKHQRRGRNNAQRNGDRAPEQNSGRYPHNATHNATYTLPALSEIEDFIWRAAAIGFPLMSLSLLTGAIWAQEAWGDYWSWDPKETWALIVWLVYVIYFHARVAHGWGGRRTAVIVIIGFGAVLFTLWGVPELVQWAQLESLHVY